MRALAFCVAAFAIQPSLCVAQTNSKPARTTTRPTERETSHLDFVAEYIRELAEVERIRAAGEEETNRDTAQNKLPFSDIIHTSTLFQLELGSQVRTLKRMHLSVPFDDLIPNIATFYERKIELWQRMGEIGGAFVGGPQPGADYNKLAAEMPQIRARLEYIDKSLFDATPLIFSTLIDMKEDSKGHANHLTITKEERARLISKLDDFFGEKLQQKDQNYIVASAQVLKDYLNKDFKCADEPWE